MATPPRQTNPLVAAVSVNAGLVAFMWVLEIIDQLTNNSLDQFGIQPRDVDGLWTILSAPLLHFGWAHLISNSVPLIVLGILIYLSGAMRWVITAIVTVIVSGLTVWLLAPPQSMTLGASGLVFGFLAYLLVRGVFTRKIGQIILAVVILVVYGGVLWGILPTQAGVSWQAHLGGAVGGVLAAWLMHGRDERRVRGTAEYKA